MSPRFFVASRVAFVGSRGLPFPVVGGLVFRVLAVCAGAVWGVGCCVGADAAVLAAALARGFSPSSSGPRLVLFSAFGSSGRGSWRGSAVSLVRWAAGLARSPGHGLFAPVALRWWAGGPASVPLVARLRRRSLALVGWAAGGGPGSCVVAFVSGGPSSSRGSWGAVRAALAAGLPVFVFPVGCSVGSALSGFSPPAGVRVSRPSSGVFSRSVALLPA